MEGIQKHSDVWKSSAGIKLQSLQEYQELQLSNLKNIQSEIIQVILLDLKVHWNQVQKPP